jgi:hypothetical protein
LAPRSEADQARRQAEGETTHFYLRDIGSTTGTFIMVR